jgi:hypothetical protein
MKVMLSEVKEYVLPIFGAIIGSALRITQRLKSDGAPLSKLDWVYELVLSASIAFIAILACDYYQLDSKLSAGIGFVSSYAGIAVVDALKSAFLGKIKGKND